MNRLASLLALALALAPGCGGGDTPGTDDAGIDASSDGAVRDAGHPVDAGRDVGSTISEAGTDAGTDASFDMGTDAPADMGTDAPADMGTDAPADMGTDAFDPCATVTCTPSDACHTVGTCDHATGTCSHPTVTDGTSCTLPSGPGACIAGTCLPECADTRRDGSETDIDCGGGVCAGCAVGGRCSVNSDCAGNACSTITSTCVATQCSDGHLDGSETDTDCGGGTCSTCAIGHHCSSDSDCMGSACDAISLVCVASQCSDHRQDGSETDIDCGGGTCSTCAIGHRCTADTDCMGGACDAISLQCVASQCSDHRHDGSETDTDCGGGICPACATGAHCSVDGDCSTNACDAISLLCVTSQCNDHRTDGSESDVDCGGLVCAACGVGKHCSTSFDCQSGRVCSVAHLCQ